MKLIIQIPCFNEAKTLPQTLSDLPRTIPGIDVIEVLVIDDGSADETSQVAKDNGVSHVLRNTKNLGLAKTFRRGLNHSLALGADIIVNTDADNQYCGDEIPKLLAPLLDGSADMVIGARPIMATEEFSFYKKALQKFGSSIVRLASNTEVLDAPSGFRAFTRHAAKQINVFSNYTYTLETIIQGGLRELKIASVPIKTNPATRPSRLVKNIFSYVFRSAVTILRVFALYRPFLVFTWMSLLCLLPGMALGIRFLIFVAQGDGTGHVQSLILAAVLLLSGFGLLLLAIVTDLISVNRKLLEDLSLRLRNLEER